MNKRNSIENLEDIYMNLTLNLTFDLRPEQQLYFLCGVTFMVHEQTYWESGWNLRPCTDTSYHCLAREGNHQETVDYTVAKATN